MKKAALLILLVITSNISAYTEISSNITTNTTWTTGITYYVTTDINVDGSTTVLTIQPGVVVKFAPSTRLTVYGTINAIGTSGSRIYFTSQNDDSIGETITGSSGSPAAGDWDGVLLYQHPGTFDYCNIYYGGKASGGVNANIQFYFSGASGNQFTNCVSEYSAQHGVRIQQTGIAFTGNTINNNTLNGLLHSESTTSYGVTFSNNVFNNNGDYAAQISAGFLQGFSNNSGTGNGVNGFSFQGTLDATSLTLSGYDSNFPLILGGIFTIKDGQTLSISAGTIIKAESSGYLTVSGILDVNGTEGNEVIFTSIKDDNYAGDTNGDGSATSPAPGDWQKFWVSGKTYLEYFNVLYGGGDNDHTNILYGSNSNAGTIDNCEFMYSAGYGIWANEAAFTVRYSRLANNNDAGIYIRTFTKNYIPNLGTTTEGDWGNNDLDGNGNYAIINNSGLTLSAYRNYWGATSSEGIAAKIQNLSGTVNFDPWIDSNPLPVELTSFSASIINNSVELSWQTATEVNNYGFSVERKSLVENSEWEEIGFVEGHGNSNSPKDYTFIDSEKMIGKVQYRLKQIDTDGGFEYSKIIDVQLESSKNFKLSQNYPNPFNPTTKIKYEIGNASFVTLKVYNSIGQEVVTLVNKQQLAGSYQVEFNAKTLPSGIYFYKIESGSFSKSMKMILLK